MNYKSQNLTKVAENLYRNGNGKYVARIMRNGRAHKKVFKTTDLAIARRSLREYESKVERLTGEQTKLHFQDLTERWMKVQAASGNKEKSVTRRQTAINGLLPFFKGKLVSQIEHKDVERWSMARGKVLAPQSYNIELETLKILFRYAKDDLRACLDNPADSFKKKRVEAREIKPPTKTEFAELITTLRTSPKAKTAAVFTEYLAYSGMRLWEATEVRWKDVDFTNNLLHITGGEYGTKNGLERNIELFSPLRSLLERIKPIEPIPNERVFPFRSIKQALITASKKMDRTPHFTHHDMRHFFASNALEEPAITFPVVASWLGHKDGGLLVAQRYGHLRGDFRKQLSEKILFQVPAP